MLSKVESYIVENKLFAHGNRILVGVSGGRDSIALLFALKKLGYNVSAAHCNFHLRGDESNRDQQFVEAFCNNHSIPLFQTDFQTEEYSKSRHISIEMGARELRYGWFDKLLDSEKFDFIAIAHHSDDVIETFLINMSRGTGLQGLTGIKPKNGRIVRPMLCVSRDEVTDFVSENNLRYVDDSTNFESVYMRNKMRNIIIPSLQEANPTFKKSLLTSIENLNQAYGFNLHYLEMLKKEIVSENEEEIVIDLDKIIKDEFSDYVCFELLKPYGFSPKVCRDILTVAAKKNCQGDQFLSNLGLKAIINRKKFVIKKNNPTFANDNASEEIYTIDGNADMVVKPLALKLSKCAIEDFVLRKEPVVCNIDSDLIEFPLVLRHWKKGDTFIPFGMKGRKKLSDFFIDEKLSIFEKESVWLLTSGNEIVWVVGLRTDNRFRITKNTKRVLTIEVVTKS